MKVLKSLSYLFLLMFTIFAMESAASAEWKEKVLYSFQGLPDGYQPAGGVVFDKHGNLYGAHERRLVILRGAVSVRNCLPSEAACQGGRPLDGNRALRFQGQ
jgi:hypothetical protein